MYHKQCLNCDKVAKNQGAYFYVNKNNRVRVFFKSKAYKPSNEKMSYAICIQPVHSRGPWWLTIRPPDPEVGGSSPTQVPMFVLEHDIFTPQKVLVIPRKRWLRPNMTEKLFTGTLSIKPVSYALDL